MLGMGVMLKREMRTEKYLLALESSCDETAAAVCDLDGGLKASHIASQIEIHRLYGGVVPEVGAFMCAVVVRWRWV